MMKVLMFGWEFPPLKSGGLGTACYGLTKALSKQQVEILFVIPKSPEDMKGEYVKLIIGNRLGKTIRQISVNSILTPYLNMNSYYQTLMQVGQNNMVNYSSNLIDEVRRYGEVAREIAKDFDHEVIHAHDWLSILAGIAAKQVSGKPLIVQIHATEFDRTGGNPNHEIYQIEKQGMDFADKIVAVSNYTKSIIVDKYGINPDKIEVVHNGVDFEDKDFFSNKVQNRDPIVLFLGRITIQKGPEYFLYAAKKVLEYMPNVKFIFAGDGDMLPFCVEKAAQIGISKNVLFSGFLRGKEVDDAYRMADVYVMPSVSEPFGIAPLEAMKNGVPVIISKTSGVSEVIQNCFKIDFWDINEMSNKIIGLLNYKRLHSLMLKKGQEEIKTLGWDSPALKLKSIYERMMV